jgi:hypothetical protein
MSQTPRAADMSNDTGELRLPLHMDAALVFVWYHNNYERTHNRLPPNVSSQRVLSIGKAVTGLLASRRA